tara:strand:- start:4166 stop:4897 length:732 start_codon:yes stop_codon:yes gene_type:complete
MKALIFGCSFSQGSYSLNKPIPEETCDHNVGWWSYVDCLKNAQKDIFATGGCSYNAWTLLYDYYIKLKNYDLCLIQETTEPRVSLLSLNLVKKHIEHFRPDDKTNLYLTYDYDIVISPSYMHYVTKDRLESKYGIKFSDKWIEELNKTKSSYQIINYKSLKQYLVHRLKEDKIPIYFFNMANDRKTFYGGIDLGINELYIDLTDFHTFPIKSGGDSYPHFTEEGNKIIGDLVNQKLKKYINAD